MPQTKKPSYYEKKYFDEKFGHVVEKLTDLESEVKRINGNVSAVTKTVATREAMSNQMIKRYIPEHKKVIKKINGLEKRYLYASGFATGIGTLFGYIVSNFIN